MGIVSVWCTIFGRELFNGWCAFFIDLPRKHVIMILILPLLLRFLAPFRKLIFMHALVAISTKDYPCP